MFVSIRLQQPAGGAHEAGVACRERDMEGLLLALPPQETQVPQHPGGHEAVQAAAAEGWSEVGARLELQVH